MFKDRGVRAGVPEQVCQEGEVLPFASLLLPGHWTLIPLSPPPAQVPYPPCWGDRRASLPRTCSRWPFQTLHFLALTGAGTRCPLAEVTGPAAPEELNQSLPTLSYWSPQGAHSCCPETGVQLWNLACLALLHCVWNQKPEYIECKPCTFKS